MKTYQVTVPFAGTMFIEVEAESEDEAIEKAIENVTSDHIESWEAHRQIVQGNVLYAQQNEAEATEIT